MAAGAAGRRNGKAVRAHWLPLVLARVRRLPRRGPFLGIKSLDALQRYHADVAANAAFAEHERHPGLEASQQPWLHGGVGVEIVVGAGCKGVEQVFQPTRALAV